MSGLYVKDIMTIGDKVLENPARFYSDLYKIIAAMGDTVPVYVDGTQGIREYSAPRVMTLRKIFETCGIGYLDPVLLNEKKICPGDFDKSLEELGITTKAYLSYQVVS